MNKITSVIKNLVFLFFFFQVSKVVTGSSIPPFSAVIGKSMEPNFYQDDFIISVNRCDISVGDVVIFKTNGLENYVIHRVTEANKDRTLFMTKGDNNPVDDRVLVKKSWISRDEIVGKVMFQIPGLGIFSRLFWSQPLWIQLPFVVLNLVYGK